MEGQLIVPTKISPTDPLGHTGNCSASSIAPRRILRGRASGSRHDGLARALRRRSDRPEAHDEIGLSRRSESKPMQDLGPCVDRQAHFLDCLLDSQSNGRFRMATNDGCESRT